MSERWRDEFSGTTMVYRMTPGEIDCSQCDYDVNMQCETRPKDVRAIREERRDKGLKPRRLRFEELQNELLVILGPEMSARDAVIELERLIQHFKSGGMLCGRDSSGEDVYESVGPKRRRWRESSSAKSMISII